MGGLVNDPTCSYLRARTEGSAARPGGVQASSVRLFLEHMTPKWVLRRIGREESRRSTRIRSVSARLAARRGPLWDLDFFAERGSQGGVHKPPRPGIRMPFRCA